MSICFTWIWNTCCFRYLMWTHVSLEPSVYCYRLGRPKPEYVDKKMQANLEIMHVLLRLEKYAERMCGRMTSLSGAI